MFKAINRETGEGVILLAARWSGEEATLRALCQQDVLVCQECRQPVRARLGEVRRWHFAHKSRLTCALTSESPALLQARAALYLWLVGTFGEEDVGIEQRLPGTALPRPIDCVVWTDDRQFAFWVADKELRPAQRGVIQRTVEDSGLILRWIFTSRLCVAVDAAQEGRATQGGKEELVLSTMLRELAHASAYNRLVPPHSGSGGTSLHFLDPEASTVITYRGLRNTHGPQVFTGQRVEAPLPEMRMRRRSRKLVHPGEHERLTELRDAQAKAKQEAKARAQREAEEAMSHPPPPSPAIPPACGTWGDPPVRSLPTEDIAASAIYGGQKLVCLFCGVLTEDWWAKERDGVHGRCRTCYRAGKA